MGGMAWVDALLLVMDCWRARSQHQAAQLRLEHSFSGANANKFRLSIVLLVRVRVRLRYGARSPWVESLTIVYAPHR